MKVAIVTLACLLCGNEAGAQAVLHSSDSTSTSVFRSAVDLVPLNVIVTDAKDKLVTGLTQQNFTVFEDGVQQEVSFFAAANVPLDMAILIDSSSSMSDKMSTVQQAAIGFASHLREGDRIAVVGIKDSARTLHPLDGDLAAAADAIRRATAGGGTALYNGLYTTIKEMQRVHQADGEVRRQAIAVLTDGDDTASIVTFDDLLAVARQAGIAIYTIALKSPTPTIGVTAQRYFNESSFGMKTLAQETGARSFFPTDIAQLSGIYSVITDELANQYAIGYSSKNPRQDGSFRRIMVRVDEPNVRTRTRTGYQALTQSVSVNR